MKEIPTFHDAYLICERFAARRGVGVSAEDVRAAVIDAYQEVVDEYRWSYQKKTHRINLEAPQSTGSVEYDSDNNTLTLTGATWPSDAIDWCVVVNDIRYDIATRTSDTVVTLDTIQKPTSDISSGTSYEAFKRYYVLPEDFVSSSDPLPEESSNILGKYLPPHELFGRMRSYGESGEATCWTVAPVPDVYGRFALYTWPAHSTAETVDLWYRNQPRPLVYAGTEKKCSAGTIAVTSGSAAVTGTSTTFEDGMEGSIFRVGDSATYQPTGRRGVRPWVEQRSILTYTNTTSITLDNDIATTRAGVKYTVTDPLDVDPAAVPAVFRLAERNLSQMLGGREVPRDVVRAEQAIQQARGAANRTGDRRRIAGAEVLVPRRPTTGDYYVDS